MSRAINVYRNPRELFRVLANELRQVVDFDFVALFLYDEVANKIKNAFLETLGKSGFVIPSDFPAEETITWWVYHHQEPVLIASRDQEHRFPGMMELYKRSGVESACILPLTTAYRRWSASSTMNGEDFPELLKAVSSTNWPTFVADEKCAMPSHAGEGFSGPVCTGTAIEVAARADLQCEMPSVGEDFAGEVCSETTPGATTNAAEQRAQERRHSGGEQVPLVANEVKMQLDLQLTRVDSPMQASSGQ